MRRIVPTLLGLSVSVLLAVGLIVLASAGSENGFRLFKDPNHFFFHQLVWFGLSIPCLVAAALFDYRKWRDYPWLTIVFYVVIVLLMVAVFFFPKVNGSRRWVVLGPLRLQPSEFAKLAAVIATSVFLDRIGPALHSFWRGSVRACILVALLMALAIAEPDFGATMVIGLTGGTLFLVSGMRIVHMIGLGAAGLAGVVTLLAFNANRMNRIFSWVKGMFGSVDPSGAAAVLSDKEIAAAHQVNMALVAIQQGGVTGVGYLDSKQKLAYLPEAHTDFIFAIGAEELGLFFSLGLLLFFVIFFVCGMYISAHASDRLGRYLAYGMTFLIFFQAVFNIGVVTKCLPTKGLALPFISYGGTNLLTAMIAVGVLFNIGRRLELPKSRPRSTISPVFSTQGV